MDDADMSDATIPDEDFPDDLDGDFLEDIDEEYDPVTEDPSDDSARVLFPHLREISSQAAWTVSSHKPHCGVSALRQPSTTSFWQSDGPQPHTLTLHFAKRVKIAYMRMHINHELDESYTPTKIQIWAGTGYHDLSCVTEMNLEAPQGWLPVDLSNAGGPSEFAANEDPYQFANEVENLHIVDEDRRIWVQCVREGRPVPEEIKLRQEKRERLNAGRGPTLRCFLVQVRVMENHQNGKDTHLRGFQVFAKDHEAHGRQLKDTAYGISGVESLAKPQDRIPHTKGDELLDRLGASLQQPEWMSVPELR
ncbi:MAG: hypothetical protein Q9159_007034 [Coniocarpon cinnabarinum]